METQWPLVLFTFFNCLAGGIFFAQGILTLQGRGKAMQTASCASALVSLAVGGLAVFMHLENPLRMLNGFGHITSGITIELIFVVLFGLGLVLYWLMARRAEDGMAPKWCGVVAVVLSLALPFVTGESYLMAAIPAWNTMLLPAYYVLTTVLLGGLASMIIAAAAKCDEAVRTTAVLALAGAVATLVASIAYAVFIGGLGDQFTDMQYYFDPTLPDIAMRDVEGYTGAIMTGAHALTFWGACIVVGCVVPGILAALVLFGKVSSKQLLVVAVIALVCAAAGTIFWRVLLYEVAVSVFVQFHWGTN